MASPGIHVAPRLLAGSLLRGKSIVVIGAPTVAVYLAGIPQVVLDPNDGASIDVRIVRGNGDITRPSNVPWAITGVGSNPLTPADFVGGRFPSGTAAFQAGDADFLVQLNFAPGQPPAVSRTAAITLGAPDWGNLDAARTQGVIVVPHVLPPDEDLTLWRTAWTDPATDVPSGWVLWGGTGAGAVVAYPATGFGAGGLRVFPGADPSAAAQHVVLWNRTPLPGADWRIAFTYARQDTAAPTPLAAVATSLLLACRGVAGYPADPKAYVGPDTTTPVLAHLVANLDGWRLAIDNLHGADDHHHVLRELPGDVLVTPASDPDFDFTPPTTYDVAVEKVGGQLTVKWRPHGGAWEDYTVPVPAPVGAAHTGLAWGLFVAPNRDAAFSGIVVSSYLGDTSRLLPFDPVALYGNYSDAPPPVAVEVRTVSTVAQLLAAHDTVAPNGHIVVADGVRLDQDFDLARSLPPGTSVVVRPNSPQGATLNCAIRIFGDGWELRDFAQAPRSSPVARIRVIDADRVRVSRIDCSAQTGAFAVITVEGDRPCSDIRIDRCTIRGHTTWAVAILATADKNVTLDWNEIPTSLLTTVGGGVLVGADAQANGLVLVKAAAFNNIGALRAPYAFLVRASGGVYFRNTVARGATGCDVVDENGTANFHVANTLSGGARLLVRGLKPVLLGNQLRGTGATNPCCILYGGTYDPASDGFEPGFPTQAQLQRLTGIAGIVPREAASAALLASNDFEGTISVGANSVADAVRPVPARGSSIFDHAGPGTVSAGATWDVGTQYRPAAARPSGISVPPTFALKAGDAGVGQDDSILIIHPPPPARRFFADAVAWNTPVSGLPLATAALNQGLDSATLVQRLVAANPYFRCTFDNDTFPVYEANTSTPMVALVIDDVPGGSVPQGTLVPFDTSWVPSGGPWLTGGVRPGPSSRDAQLVILLPWSGKEYDLWQVSYDAVANKLHCTHAHQSTDSYLTGTGNRPGSRSIGILYSAMTGLAREMALAGGIDHALAVGIPNEHNSIYYAPANGTDGASYGTPTGVPAGTRFSLLITDPQIEAIVSAYPASLPTAMKDVGRKLLRTLRKYGFFITDNAGAAHFWMEDRNSGGPTYASIGMAAVTVGGVPYPERLLQGVFTTANLQAYVPSDKYVQVGTGDPVKPWWRIPGGNRSGKLWNRGPGLTFAASAWTPTMGALDVTTGASHRNESTMNEVIGGPISANLADYDDFSKIQNGSQPYWPGTTMDNAAQSAVSGKTWLIWVMDTNPTGGPFDTSSGPGNNTYATWANPGVHDDWWYAMGRRTRATMLHYGLKPWQLMLRINHEMVQSNNYQIYYATGPDYAKAIGRFIDGFRKGYSAHSPDDYARMIFSPSRHWDCGPLERFFTCDPVNLTTPFDLVDVSAHPAATMDQYAGQSLAVQTREVNTWIAGGHDPGRRTVDLPASLATANYAQNCTVDDHSMIKLAKKYKIGMCNSEWSPRYDQGGCQVAPGVYQAMHDWFTLNAAWYAFECVFHSNTLQDLPAITNWKTGKDLFVSLWTGDPAEKNPAPATTDPGSIHTGQLTLAGGGGPTANRSGLTWPSGMCDDSSLADMMVDLNAWETARGRLCDVSTQFFGRQHTSWTQLTDNFLLKPTGLVAQLIASNIMPALTISPFSSAMPGLSVAAAARGDYDSYHLLAAQKIAALGVPVIIRLAHECDDDGNVYSYYHSGVTAADFIAMFRRLATIYKTTIGADCRIDWNHLRQAGQASGHDEDPDTFYPGDDVVDIISSDDYGNSPRGNPSAYIVTDDDWTAYLNNTSPKGFPQGPATWLAYAVSKNKQYAVPEWGVTNWMGPNTVADSARYIQGMYEFFRDNAPNIAYENYFNRIAGTAVGGGGHKLFPAVDNPLASAEYMKDWAQVVSGVSYVFGTDWTVNWAVKKGSATASLVAQPAPDTVVLTAGSDNSKQAALFFLCKQRPGVTDGTWRFFYTRLDANVHTDALGIETMFVASYVGAGGSIPANPANWGATIFRPASGEPCGDSVLAQDGDGLRVGFDVINEPSPAKTGVLDGAVYQTSLARPALGLQAGAVNRAVLAPNVEWAVTVVLSGRTLSFRATAPLQVPVGVVFDDAAIPGKAGGWFGFRLDRGRSCKLRALTYVPG
jgi:hypothetical protein